MLVSTTRSQALGTTYRYMRFTSCVLQLYTDSTCRSNLGARVAQSGPWTNPGSMRPYQTTTIGQIRLTHISALPNSSLAYSERSAQPACLLIISSGVGLHTALGYLVSSLVAHLLFCDKLKPSSSVPPYVPQHGPISCIGLPSRTQRLGPRKPDPRRYG
jgi:hypothetical protein